MRRFLVPAMLALLLLLMAPHHTGHGWHKQLGALFLALALTHLALNRRWWRSLAFTPYTWRRGLLTAVNLLLLAATLGLLASGLVFLYHWRDWYALARPAHLVCAYWFFLLTAAHLGWHLAPRLRALPRAVPWLLGLYGAFAFTARGYLGNLVLVSPYARLDFAEAPWLFALDHVAIFAAFAVLAAKLANLRG